jgi:hypothetical protein
MRRLVIIAVITIAVLAAAAWLLTSREVGIGPPAPVVEQPAPARAPALPQREAAQREEPEIGTGTTILRGPGADRGSP